MLPGIRQIPPDLKPSPPIASSPPAAHNDFLLLTAMLQAASSKRFIFSHNCFMSVLLSVSYMLFHDNHGTGWIVTISYFYKRICPHDLYRPTSSGILGLPDTSTQTEKVRKPRRLRTFLSLKIPYFQSSRPDSNRRPTHYECVALPTALRKRQKCFGHCPKHL